VRYLGGVVPARPDTPELGPAELDLQDVQRRAFEDMSRAIDDLALGEALKAVWSFVRRGNAYVEEVAPWALAKQEGSRRRLEVVLYELLDSLRLLALMTAPITPRAADELWSRVGGAGSVHDCVYGTELAWGGLTPGSQVRAGPPLFPRIET
jgi:methionyl-tRNA synthetase